MFASDPPGTAARRAALRLLDAVTRQSLPLEAALARATAGLAPADRGFAHAIAATALRWLPDLDRLIDGATRQRLPADAKARAVLRITLAQVLKLDVQPHAAVATALPLVMGGPRRLVHGVVGTLLRADARLPDVPALPHAVEARWRAAWGEAAARAAARALAAPPPLDLTLADPDETAALAAATGGVSLATGHLRLPAGTDVRALSGFAEGRWWVQDIAASLPARLAGAGAGRRALDLCAAPGGKALQLAAAGWQVSAIDQSTSRLERLRDNLARTGLAVAVVAADMLDWSPPAPAELVLLDAPCSASGIFRRHPDVLHRATAGAIAALADGQRRMLARAADWVAPGGLLIYAVCSLEPAEGEEIVASFGQARSDFTSLPVTPAELPPGFAPDEAGTLRVPPGTLADAGGADGFFVARFRRRD